MQMSKVAKVLPWRAWATAWAIPEVWKLDLWILTLNSEADLIRIIRPALVIIGRVISQLSFLRILCPGSLFSIDGILSLAGKSGKHLTLD